LLEGDAQPDAIDLRVALGRHDGDDLVGDAERERPLLVVDRESRGVFAELVDADLVELREVDDVLRELDAARERVRIRHARRRDEPVRAEREPAQSAAHRGVREDLVRVSGSPRDERQVLGQRDPRLGFGLQHLIDRNP
jgi:hypothetical protein